MSDLSSILIWWFTIFIIGGIAYPVTARLFSRFTDNGYIFSKAIGILVSSYVVWLLGSLHVLPFSKMTIILVCVGWMLVNIFIFKDRLQKIPWKWIVLEEILFFATLAFWSYIRATEPSIHGLEKFMDFGFVNSILRTSYFPPLDMWLAQSPDFTGGHFINYYYFGHYYTAFLTKLSGIDSAITYNLMIATLFAFTFMLSFSLGVNLLYLFQHATSLPREALAKWGHLKLLTVGLLAAFLVSLGGNLHTIYVFTEGYQNFEQPEPFWTIPWGFHPDRYWYPNATRFIPNTIHEFPIYSFVVSDLHGHVADIPFVLLVLAILLNLIIRPSLSHVGNPSHVNPLRKFLFDFEHRTGTPLFYILLLGMILAVMYMTNAWDGMIYMILTCCVILYRNFKYVEKQQSINVFYRTFSASLFLVFVFLISSLPFSFNFKPFVSGVGVLCAPKFLEEKTIGPLLFEKDHCQKSPLYMLATLWGFFFYSVIGFLIFVVFPTLKKTWEMRNRKLDAEAGSEKSRKSNYLTISLQYLASHISHLTSIDVYVLILVFISTLLIAFPEFLYLKDIYPAHYRANTMFKLGYQAFMMLGLVSAYVFFRIKHFDKSEIRNPKSETNSKFSNSKFKTFWAFLPFEFSSFVSNFVLRASNFKIGFLLLFILIAIYPYFAINSYYDRLRNYRGLYGLNWLNQQYPDDYSAIVWLRNNIVGQPVIAEANGESYTDYARVSANTGLPTIVGWPVHEWLWRGSYDEAGKRIPEVELIYKSEDIEQTKELLKKYNVEYIFLGALEREKYKEINEKKLSDLGTVVFESGETKVYRVNAS